MGCPEKAREKLNDNKKIASRPDHNAAIKGHERAETRPMSLWRVERRL
jgi:hypothetical protein